MSYLAFFIANLGGGGAERATIQLATQLSKRGHRVDILLGSRGGELCPLVPPGIKIVEFGANRIRNTVAPLARYLRSEKPDSLLAIIWPYTIIGVLAKILARSPVRLTLIDHTSMSLNFADRRRLLRRTMRLFYPLADARLIVSEGSAEDASTLSGLDKSSWTVAYNPVALPPLPDIPKPIEAWPGTKERILNIANLSAVKNHALLLRAFAHLKKLRPEAGLIILGDGSKRAELKNLAHDLQISDSVRFEGFVVDPWPYLQTAHVFALTSDFEGFSIAIVEALYAGLQVVATDCPHGPREILANGQYGTLVPNGSATAVADAIDFALSNPIDKNLLRDRAVKLSGEGQIDIYESVLLGPALPTG